MGTVSGSTQTARASASPGSGFERLHRHISGGALLRACRGQRVLDLGHGAPQVTEWLRQKSVGALEVIDRDGCNRDDLDTLPIPGGDGSYDFVFALRTMAHLGTDDASSVARARGLLRMVTRALRPRGVAMVEIANPTSFRGIMAGIRHPVTVIRQAPREHFVFADRYRLTRYDNLRRLYGMLPEALRVTRVTGIGVLSPSDRLLDIPLVRHPLTGLEKFLAHSDLWKRFGAYLLVSLRKT